MTGPLSLPFPRHLRLAVVLFPNAFPLDFIGPLDILNTVQPSSDAAKAHDLSITSTIVAASREPVELSGGLKVVPDLTFDEALQDQATWDAVLVPGGRGARPWFESNEAARGFLEGVVPRLKVVLTVCTGSWLLAHTGALRGQKATTNKAAYKACVDHTADKGVEWVPKARYVVSDKFWTSSGVTAGIDMTSAFLRVFLTQHLGDEAGKTLADKLLGVLEVIAHDQGDDPWAEYWGVS